MIFAEYGICAECNNPYAIEICLHCGQCGRIFEDGICTNIGWFPSIDNEEKRRKAE